MDAEQLKEKALDDFLLSNKGLMGSDDTLTATLIGDVITVSHVRPNGLQFTKIYPVGWLERSRLCLLAGTLKYYDYDLPEPEIRDLRRLLWATDLDNALGQLSIDSKYEWWIDGPNLKWIGANQILQWLKGKEAAEDDLEWVKSEFADNQRLDWFVEGLSDRGNLSSMELFEIYFESVQYLRRQMVREARPDDTNN